jgi:hypothetical protein
MTMTNIILDTSAHIPITLASTQKYPTTQGSMMRSNNTSSSTKIQIQTSNTHSSRIVIVIFIYSPLLPTALNFGIHAKCHYIRYTAIPARALILDHHDLRSKYNQK